MTIEPCPLRMRPLINKRAAVMVARAMKKESER